MKIYSVRDRLTSFLDPFLCANDRDAIFMVKQAVLHPDSKLHEAPDDFELFAIGEFNDKTGRIEPYSDPVSVILVKECV